MASDEPAKPGPVVLRIKLRYEDVDTMVHRFAPNVGKSGLFIPTRSLQPLGAEIKFELRLANDMPVLVGHGRVKHVREPDPKNPKASFGMAVELMRVTRESRDVILRMLERRKTLGLAEVGIPMPEDLEVPVAKEPAPPTMTAPRRQSGSIPVANLTSIAALAPEPARKKRPVMGELIASASGPVAQVAMPELDENVDVAAAIARARVLAVGTDLDAELEALRDSAAAPIEISIEAASAELARRLGGIAVTRNPSAGWAAPPQVVTEAPPAAEVVASPPPEPEPVVARTRTPVFEGEQLDQLLAEDEPTPDPALLEARSRERRLHLRASRTRSRDLQRPAPEPEPAIEPQAEPAPEPEAEEIAVSEAEVVGETVLANMPTADHGPEEAEVLQSPRLFVPAGVDDITTDPHAEVISHGPHGPMIDDESDPELFAQPPMHTGEHELLDDEDLEEVEHTQMGVDPDAFSAQAYATEPAAHDHEALADSLDQQLAESEGEDEPLEAPEPEEISDAEELDDMDILAEADADDADLLLADGEADSSEPLPSNEIVPARPSEMDFVARLDFGGEATPVPRFDPLSGFERDSVADFGAPAHHMGDDDDFGEPYTRRSDPSAFVEPIEALPRFEIAGDEPNVNYDIPAIEEDDFHERRAANPPQISVRTKVLNPDETFMEHAEEPQYFDQAPHDLDDALEALDVDVDDLSIPHARRPTTGVSRVAHKAGAPAVKPKRAPSEDGILIDFGDDDD